MEIAIRAFQLAHRGAKIPSVEDGLKDIAELPSATIEKQVGMWEYQILAQAVLVLRRRGLPQPDPSGRALFAQTAMALRTCQEITDDVADDSGGGKPSR